MSNVLNPEPESITLNTELETPTLEPATESEQPSYESTSNPEKAQVAQSPALDADAPTETGKTETAGSVTEEAAPAEETAPQAQAEVAPEPAHAAHDFQAGESMDDFSAALEAFEREQAAEAAAVEAYGDKLVTGTVIKQTEKHLVVDVGLKSEGLVPLEQVQDHTGAVKFNPGDVIDVVIEREEQPIRQSALDLQVIQLEFDFLDAL
jgi:small subunit ribosomal protein S1